MLNLHTLKIFFARIAYLHNLPYTPNISNPEVVKVTPLERILLETDSPYFPPVHRKKPSFPWYVQHVAREIATILDLPIHEVVSRCYQNACQLYPKIHFDA